MKKIAFLFIAFSISIVASAQNDQYIKKVKTLDSTIETLYSVISGSKGEARDWDLMRFLFHSDANLIPSGKSKSGNYNASYITPDIYIQKSGQFLVDNGFFEKEIHRVIDTFGNISHVFSTYECFKTANDTIPFMRGINSIQLLNDGNRWWIINIYWAQESPDNPIPEKYLLKK